MTPEPGPHLTPDDLDAWLVGALAPTAQDHLSHCPSCQERADTEREIVALLGALPRVSPAPGFADRVMARVTLRSVKIASSATSIFKSSRRYRMAHPSLVEAGAHRRP